jgi:hypothetical protein
MPESKPALGPTIPPPVGEDAPGPVPVPGPSLTELADIRARYLDPATSGHERERRIRPLLLPYITTDANGIESYAWPAGLDLRGIPDPDGVGQLHLFGKLNAGFNVVT